MLIWMKPKIPSLPGCLDIWIRSIWTFENIQGMANSYVRLSLFGQVWERETSCNTQCNTYCNTHCNTLQNTLLHRITTHTELRHTLNYDTHSTAVGGLFFFWPDMTEGEGLGGISINHRRRRSWVNHCNCQSVLVPITRLQWFALLSGTRTAC